MKLGDIYQFVQTPPLTFLCQELALCYILSVLIKGESYRVELMERLKTEYPTYRLSATMLDSALSFLEAENAVFCYPKNNPGPGHPRLMFEISPSWLLQATELAGFWQQYTKLN